MIRRLATIGFAHEWNNKAAGFVGYGGAGGVRAVENLRLVRAKSRLRTCGRRWRSRCGQTSRNFTTFKPHERHDKAVHLMADEVVAWGAALKTLRTH
jgi:NAD(P)H-dependent FMN reductase